MKENPYDNSVFFAKYGEMLRSKKGLNGGGRMERISKAASGFCRKEGAGFRVRLWMAL